MTQSTPETGKTRIDVAQRPFLKWAGGKGRLLSPILEALPDKIETYYEPFVGSGAVFFALASRQRFKRAVLGDRNAELIDVYQAIQGDVEGVIKALKRHEYDKEHFYKVRAQEPSKLSLVRRAARTIFLNKAGFNGLYRVNKSGKFNVPFGRHVNPTICDAPRLRNTAQLLRGVELRVADFESVCADAKRGDAIYLDPPYVPLSKTASFTAYSTHEFTETEHTRLADFFRTTIKKRVALVLSNSDTPLTQELYADWELQRIEVKRPINSKVTHRGAVGEILVTGRKRS